MMEVDSNLGTMKTNPNPSPSGSGNESGSGSGSATMSMSGQKRTFEEMKESTHTDQTNSQTTPTQPTASQANALHQLKTILTQQQPSWTDQAITFAQTRLMQDEPTMREFTGLIATIMEATKPATTNLPTQPSSAQTPQPSAAVGREAQQAPAPSASLGPAPTLAPIFAPAASPSAQSVPAAAAALPEDLIVSIADVSLLWPKGKFTLQLTPSQLIFHYPASTAKNMAVSWNDLELIVDVPDLNKRDWLIVLQFKKGKGLMVGKKLHAAVVLKFVATEKVKADRFQLAKSADAKIAADVQAVTSASGFVGSKVTTAVVNVLRSIPSVKSLPIVGHEPAIFDSQQKLPCVNCKHGVEDGSLYFLRTGLMFIKPVQYVRIADIDGIDPARGMSSTFDMKVGIQGQKGSVDFIMISPKEEGSITKYCQFLAKEQARLDKEEKQRKAGIEVAAQPAAAYVSSSHTAPAAVPSTTIIEIDDTPSSVADPSISAKNILSVSRAARASRPKTFQGMDVEEEEEEAKPKKKETVKGRDEEGEEDEDADEADSGSEDSASVRSSDDEDFSADESSSDDSAEYDSAKDDESIHSEDERERERKKRERGSSDEDEDEDDQDEDVEMVDVEKPKAKPTPPAAASSSSISVEHEAEIIE